MTGRAPRALLRGFTFLSALGGAAAWWGWAAPVLDIAAHFALPGLAAALAGLAAWALIAPRDKSAAAFAITAVLAWGGLVAPDAVASLHAHRTEPLTETVKIIQFNLWADDDSAQAKLAWLRQQDADVIVLEEVAGFAKPVLAGLADLYPYHMTCESRPHPCEVVILAKRQAVAEGYLSSRPDAPNSTWAQFSGPGGGYAVVGTHITEPSLAPRQRTALNSLSGLIQRLGPDNVIAVGDFNAAPWSSTLRRFEGASGLARRTYALPTWPARRFGPGRWPAPFAILPLDQVYAGHGWKTVQIERGPWLGSDHYPVIARLTR